MTEAELTVFDAAGKGGPVMGTTPSSGCGGATPTAASSTTSQIEVNEGEVVLDVLHRLQATQTPDLAVRWNCKAGKCGSCIAGDQRQAPPGCA